MRSIVLSLLLLVSGLFASAAVDARTPAAFPAMPAHDWIASAAPHAPAGASSSAHGDCALPHSFAPAASAPEAAVQGPDACGGPSQAALDDRNEMIGSCAPPGPIALAYSSPRNALAPHGVPAPWQRMPLRPPRA